MNIPERLSGEMDSCLERILIRKITQAINEYESATGRFVKKIEPIRVVSDFTDMGSEVESVKVFTTIHIRDMIDGLGLTIDEITDTLCKK